MEPNSRDSRFFEEASSRLEELRRLEEVVRGARQSLEKALEDYRLQGRSVESIVRVQAHALLADALVYPRQIPGILGETTEDYAPRTEPDIILGMDGSWRSYELGRVLQSIEYVFEIVVLGHQAESLRPATSDYPNTREHIYLGAHLHAFMHRGEELRIKRISYASPGMIELVSQVLALSPCAATSISILFMLFATSPRIVRAWVNIWRTIVQTRRANAVDREAISRLRRKEAWNRRISEWYSRALEEAAGSPQAVNAANELRNMLVKIAETDAVDPERLTDRAFESLITLERNVEAGKLSLRQPKRRGRESKA